MNLEELYKSGNIILDCIAGSHLYGLNTPESDVDKRGIFVSSIEEHLSLIEPSQEISDEKSDIKYYELTKLFKLAIANNPSILELLFIPPKKRLKTTRIYDLLYKHRKDFISKRCYYTYSGYAYAQIKRAKGQNKKVHNVNKYVNEKGLQWFVVMLNRPEGRESLTQEFNKHFIKYLDKIKGQTEGIPESLHAVEKYKYFEAAKTMFPPKKEDYCYYVDVMKMPLQLDMWEQGIKEEYILMPFRPKKISRDILSATDCSSVEHMTNMYRVYDNGKGVFRGGQLVLTSISKEREWEDFYGVMFYNHDGYEKDLKEFYSFWEWMANKNDQRWKTQESGEMDFDVKNLMHTMRLLFEADSIVRTGEPTITFTGEKQKFLKDIRKGVYNYDYLLKMAEDECERLKGAYEQSDLPDKPNMKKLNKLYQKLLNM